MLCLITLLIFGSVKADAIKQDDEKLTVDYAVNIYVNAITLGQVKGLDAILDENLKYTLERGGQTLVFAKKDVLNSFKGNENVKQECLVATTVDSTTPDVTIVKVEMQYNDFKRTNYVTMANSGRGWKIVNIYSTFK